MNRHWHWTLGNKLALVTTPFLLLAMACIAALLWMSWQLEGGAAAVNEAGRMRMQAYRLVLSVGTGQTQAVPRQVAEFESSLQLLRQGDRDRPLFVPQDDAVAQRFAAVEREWAIFRARFAEATPPAMAASLGEDAARFASNIDGFVVGIEACLTRLTSLMHLLQVAMMGWALVGAALLVYTGYLFVLEPVGLLKQAIGGHDVAGTWRGV